MRSRFSPLLALTSAVIAIALALPLSASAEVTTTVRFDFTGTAQKFNVPTGVTSVHVAAIGGRGGDNGTATVVGGRAEIVTADVPVTPGSLTVMVAGNGADGAGITGGASGFNGGGAGGSSEANGNGAGGGGGASTLLAGAARLLVAAGGAGAGGDFGANAGGAAGDAGIGGLTGQGLSPGGGGAAGKTGSAGAGGAPPASDCGTAGGDGKTGAGGDGGGNGAFAPGGPGGGGGGGLKGGGGGASGCNGSAGGGGGGGATFAEPSAAHVVTGLDSGGVPSITISYVSAGPAAAAGPSPIAFGTVPQGTVSAPQAVTVSNTGAAPLNVEGVIFTGPSPGEYLVDATGCMAPVAPGSSCPIVVRFAPEAQDERDATMQIATDGGTPAVNLTGTGGPLPQGPPGDPGPTGAKGPPGPVAHALAVVLAAASYAGRAGSPLTLRYATTLSATVTAELIKRGHIVLRSQVSAGGGRNSLRIAHLPKARGRYQLELFAEANGQAATDTANLTVTKAHKAKARRRLAARRSIRSRGSARSTRAGRRPVARTETPRALLAP